MATETLARFVIETRTNNIPNEILKAAQDALIDTVGVALAGTLEPVGELALRWVSETGAKAQATLLGQNTRTSAAEAAFANGMCAHALDFDDSIPTLRGHPSATMGPAALAVAEAAGASGAGARRVRARARSRRRARARGRLRALPQGVALDRNHRRFLFDGRGRAAVGPHRGSASDGVGTRGVADERGSCATSAR